MALTKCPDCGSAISTEAPSCPKCGRPNAPPKKKTSPAAAGCGTVVLLIVVIGVLSAIFSDDNSKSNTSSGPPAPSPSATRNAQSDLDYAKATFLCRWSGRSIKLSSLPPLRYCLHPNPPRDEAVRGMKNWRAALVRLGGAEYNRDFDTAFSEDNAPESVRARQAAATSPSEQPPALNDAAALDAKYGIPAMSACSVYADDYLRKIAKYDFKWDDVGFLGQKFDKYLQKVRRPGVITMVSDKAKLQNGFGAFQHIELLCDYDTQADKVLEFWTPGTD